MLRGILTLLFALCFPASGMARGLHAIYQRSIRGKTPLEVACKSGALCVIVRSPDWMPPSAAVQSSSAPPSTATTATTSEAEAAAERNSTRVQDRDQSASAEKAAIIMSAEDVSTEEIEDEQSPRQNPEEGGMSSNEAVTEGELATARSTTHEQHICSGNLANPGQQSQSAANPTQQSRTLSKHTADDENRSIRPVTRWYSSRPATRWYSLSGRTIHGTCDLPRGYALSMLPCDFPTSRFREIETKETVAASTPSTSLKPISSTLNRIATEVAQEYGIRPLESIHIDGLSMSWSMSKAAIAVFQTLYAFFTLYETRGNQIETFGYAAFGLTVTPYLIMSLVNLGANIVTPDYPCIYLVRDRVMSEVEERTQIPFKRVVGEIKEIGEDDGERILLHHDDDVPFSESIMALDVRRQFRVGMIIIVPTVVLSAIPIAVIAGLTHFHQGHSTHAQRCWVMIWLVFGVWIGAYASILRLMIIETEGRSWSMKVSESEENASSFHEGKTRSHEGNLPSHRKSWDPTELVTTIQIVFFAAPGIGGLVVVGQMLSAYGDCKTLF